MHLTTMRLGVLDDSDEAIDTKQMLITMFFHPTMNTPPFVPKVSKRPSDQDDERSVRPRQTQATLNEYWLTYAEADEEMRAYRYARRMRRARLCRCNRCLVLRDSIRYG